jgi:RNA-directed DNA polymerase
MGQDMTAVRSPHRTRLPDTVGSDHQTPISLQGIANHAKPDTQHRCRDRSGGLDAALGLACWRDLNQQAASGADGRTAPAYEANLQATITALVHRLNTHRYRATRVRRGYLPKDNGSERPLGMPALEDQVGQLAWTKRLMAIDEQDLLDGSDGYRPGRGALDAVRDRTFDLQYGPYGSLVEADVKGFFDQRDHTRRWTMLRERIDDRACLRLLRTWLKAGVLETDGRVGHPETGAPPGGCLAPVLAHVDGHDALDVWCAGEVKTHCRGEARRCREADDWVWAFRYQDEAERFDRVVPRRLTPVTLQVAPENTPLLRCRRVHPSLRRRCTLLGCACSWRPERQGGPGVKRRTARKKLQAACRRITEWITPHRHLPGRACYRQLNSR